MTTLEARRRVIQQLRDLLTPPEAWTKGRYARDAKGNWSDLHSERATCWCLAGGLIRVEPIEMRLREAVERELNLFLPAHRPGLVFFNDATETTHTMVLRLLDDALANLDRRLLKHAQP